MSINISHKTVTIPIGMMKRNITHLNIPFGCLTCPLNMQEDSIKMISFLQQNRVDFLTSFLGNIRKIPENIGKSTT